MATTKIWPIKDSLKRVIDYAGNPEKTEWDDLKQTLHYAGNKEKTTVGDEQSCFVTGVNCLASIAFEEMSAVKKRFGKTGGNIAYHGYQSFRPGEVTPEQCHEVGIQLAQKLWGEKYQVLVATHLDKGHLHNHLVFNSVSFIDGKKFNDDYNAYYEMRRVSDELCRQNDLSIIEKPKGKTPRSLYFAEKNGEPTKYNLMREAIDDAIGKSKTMQQFINVMRKQGYVLDFNTNRKYPTIRSVNSKKATRMYHLGDEYLPQAIYDRVRQNPYAIQNRYYDFINPKQSYQVKPKVVAFKGHFSRTRKISGLKALFLIFYYLLGIYPKDKPQTRHKPLSPEIREACRKLERYSKEIQLVCRHNLNNIDDVNVFKEQTNSKISAVTAHRDSVYNKMRRCADPKQIAELKKQRSEYTGYLDALRKEKKVAGDILVDVENIKEKICIEREMQAAYYAPEKAVKKRGYER